MAHVVDAYLPRSGTWRPRRSAPSAAYVFVFSMPACKTGDRAGHGIYAAQLIEENAVFRSYPSHR
ncbi:hypothetical protein PATSB16_29490 [Pandoraea thiooxydans]|nr:hypothetical protein PATSB16_29490 [Pandoraea thiooxydans]